MATSQPSSEKPDSEFSSFSLSGPSLNPTSDQPDCLPIPIHVDLQDSAARPTRGMGGEGSTIITDPQEPPPWGKDMELLFPDFVIVGPLAAGAMSRVYQVMDRVSEEHFALKEAPFSSDYATSLRVRMEREWQVLRTLRHPNIVRGFELRLTERCFYVVMELVQGSTLQQLVQARGPLDPSVAADFIRQAAQGLAAAHAAGVVHRDVKPSNLLCDSDGAVKVIDFGMAWMDLPGEPSITLVHNDTLLGTVDYMAPEQAAACHFIDARADIYALGCTMYFLLTGHAPFAAGSIATRLLRHKTERAASIGQLRPEVPQSLVDLCERMMEKSPDDRFARMADVVEALESWRVEYEWGRDESLSQSPADTAELQATEATLVGPNVLVSAESEIADRPLDLLDEQEPSSLVRQRREVQQLLACLDISLREALPDRPVSDGVTVLLSTLRDHIETMLAQEVQASREQVEPSKG